MAHNPIRMSVLALTAACIAQGPAAAQGNQGSAYQQLQGVQQQSDKAQRNPSLEGAKSQSGQGIDTKGSYAPPVRANPQPKPNPVGQKVYGPGGYKPAATTLRTTAPPSPGAPTRTTTTPAPTRPTVSTTAPSRATA